MILSIEDKKQVEKYKKRVHKQYPGAYLYNIGAGYYTIMQEQPGLTPKDILAEFYILPVKDPVKAWELAQFSVKTEQNLNRTHPLRIEGMDMEDKIARAETRKLKQELNKKPKKTRIWDNY